MQDFLSALCIGLALGYVIKLLRGKWRRNCGCPGCKGCDGHGRSETCVEKAGEHTKSSEHPS